MLNDRPLTYMSSEIMDPEALTPAHLIYGRRILSIPYALDDPEEIVDPTYIGDRDMRKWVDTHSQLMQRFWTHWRKEYITALREFHRSTGQNKQVIRKGDTVVVHDDAPRLHWKLAIVEEPIMMAWYVQHV